MRSFVAGLRFRPDAAGAANGARGLSVAPDTTDATGWVIPLHPMKWSVLVFGFVSLGCAALAAAVTAPGAPSLVGGASADGAAARAYQVGVLTRIAEPVLVAATENALAARLPSVPGARNQFAPLEALGRTLAGIAPWLELGPGDDAEGRERARLIELAVRAVTQATDPASPGFLNFKGPGGQPLVDTAFLAQGLLRAPTQLWGRLDAAAQARVLAALRSSRGIKPGESNWLLFSAMVEAALLEFGGGAEVARIQYAVDRHLEWYVGDGTYGDGPEFHWDYYNGFVIQPMLWEILEVCARHGLPLGAHLPLIETRARRYAAVQERLISPEGTFPVMGRSAAYRFAALQSLAQAALRKRLPEGLAPGAVRGALDAVIRRMTEAPGTFDDHGWLRIGIVGAQPASAEVYINTGSIYLCTVGLLQLGLPASDEFWTAPSAAWTQRRIWSGENVPTDRALKK